jgi:hypoxanthine phosphoribosyltransferase
MKVNLDFETISARLKHIPFPDVDLVIGIAAGGIVPASLVAHQVGRPMQLIHINYRDEDNNPRHDHPVLITSPDLPEGLLRILLVDDVSVTGNTFAVAKKHLKGHTVITFAMKGQADYVAFPEIDDCVDWAWKVRSPASREFAD